MSRHLAHRLLPLALLLALVVSISAPLAFFTLRLHESHMRADAIAERVSERLARDSHHRPRLWRYDTIKLMADLGGERAQSDIAAVAVVDHSGRPVDLGAPIDDLRGADLVWGTAPIVSNSEVVGAVWAAVSTRRLRGEALVLLVVFSTIGLALGCLVYWLPLRSVRNAEAQLTGYSELQQSDRHLRELSTRAIGHEEADRRAIARNLHDAAGQSLTAIRIKLQLTRDQPLVSSANALISEALDLTDQAMEEIRHALNSLAPPILGEVGLPTAIERLCDGFASRTRTQVKRDVVLSEPLPPALEGACYRIVQEALTNVARHAKAREVTVALKVAGECVTLSVHDDGVGFDAASPSEGRGLLGIRERVELLSGTMRIDSHPGEGTRVHVELPREERA